MSDLGALGTNVESLFLSGAERFDFEFFLQSIIRKGRFIPNHPLPEKVIPFRAHYKIHTPDPQWDTGREKSSRSMARKQTRKNAVFSFFPLLQIGKR